MDETDTSHASLYGVVQPQAPRKNRVRQSLRWLSDVAQEFLALSVVLLVAAFLLVPPALALIASVGACINGFLWLLHIVQALKAGQYQALFDSLSALENATKIAFAGITYLALLCTLNVLMAGLLGRRGQRFYLLPGLVLSVPMVMAFSIATYLLIQEITTLTLWTATPLLLFAGYAGFDAVLLALLLTDLRALRNPRRVGRRRRRGQAAETERVTIPLPILRFGPAETPRLADSTEVAEVYASMEQATQTQEASEDSEAAPVAVEQVESAQNLAAAVEEAPITPASIVVVDAVVDAVVEEIAMAAASTPEPGDATIAQPDREQASSELEEEAAPPSFSAVFSVRDVGGVRDVHGVRDARNVVQTAQSPLAKAARRNRSRNGAQLILPAPQESAAQESAADLPEGEEQPGADL